MSVQKPSKELIKQMQREQRLVNEIKFAVQRILAEGMMSKASILGCFELAKKEYREIK